MLDPCFCTSFCLDLMHFRQKTYQKKTKQKEQKKLTLNLEEPNMIVLLQAQIFIIIFIIITLHRKHQRRNRRAQTLLFCPPVVSLQMTAAHEKGARETDYCIIQTRATV